VTAAHPARFPESSHRKRLWFGRCVWWIQ